MTVYSVCNSVHAQILKMSTQPLGSTVGDRLISKILLNQKINQKQNGKVGTCQDLLHGILPLQIKSNFGLYPRIRMGHLNVQSMLFTCDGQERFYNKELHKRQFEYHRGGKMRPARPVPVDALKVIMFQGFDWESYNHNPSWWIHFQSKVEDLFELGVTDVWLPPASQAVDKQGYLPGQLYNLDASLYGKGTDLRNLLDVLHKHGICGIADIVINHRTAGKQDSNGHWNIFQGGVSDKRLAWGAWAVSI
ncbi:hypothetical protein KC19_VG303000 [Ceratodon purpureus]|uniref:1,4-alpha-D-glucan glucanohydrolase n=1 Tax=Ceratodon purpureus TaxID=3225 RepID=A0A8T0HV22_CERPU|nr:hypothetical protein KC19_VG303000 [Ceratodon purpureus]KAG0574922.1 hypothetical protein KC19_VG303000 [Ceratodon purpureus]KAG0574923.1 hypothetical protein KC19_VG303000 [Ceratodon purpureus]